MHDGEHPRVVEETGNATRVDRDRGEGYREGGVRESEIEEREDPRRESIHSRQSSPKSSHGCCVRTVPLPQARSSAGQYFGQPQQMRSGCAGFSSAFFMILPVAPA
jgi:hypothetical protein